MCHRDCLQNNPDNANDVTNDLLIDSDGRHVCLLVLLELRTAFDTADHKVFLRRLEDANIKGIIDSILDRLFSVQVNARVFHV